jgi:hypothetical protein
VTAPPAVDGSAAAGDDTGGWASWGDES